MYMYNVTFATDNTINLHIFTGMMYAGVQQGLGVYPPQSDYGLHYPTNSDNQPNHPDGPTFPSSVYPPSSTIGPSNYENWDPVKTCADKNRSHSSSCVSEVTSNLGAMRVSPPPPLPAKPLGSQEATPTSSVLPPPFSTNATSQYQTSYQVCFFFTWT